MKRKNTLIAITISAALGLNPIAAYAGTVSANDLEAAVVQEEENVATIDEEEFEQSETSDAETSDAETSDAVVETNSAFEEEILGLYAESSSLTDDELLESAEEIKSDYTALIPYGSASLAIAEYEEKKQSFFLGEEIEGYSEDIISEWTRQKYLSLFGRGEDTTLVSSEPSVYISSVEEIGEHDIQVSVETWNTEGYRIDGDDAINATAYRYTYQLQMTSFDDVWTIAAVLGTEENYSDLLGQGVVITENGFSYVESQETFTVDEEEDEGLVGVASVPSYTYNVSKAVAYADKWALSKNPKYEYWGDRGGDCANFVSQALFAGGMPKTSEWNLYGNTNAAFVNWVNNNGLRNYLVNHKMGTYVKNVKASQLKKGDLVFYNWSGDSSKTNHVTIVVGTNSSGVPIIDSHTADRLHSRWNYGASGTYYGAVQMYKTAKKTSSSSKSTTSSSSSGTSSKSSTSSNSSIQTIVIYRLYNKNSGEHFYTGNLKEKNYLSKIGWKYEGVGWYAPSKSSAPVYRLYNPNSGDHHYTMKKAEKNMLVRLGWKYEGIGWYSDTSKGVPLYRQYNPNAKAGSHNYTTSKKENNNLVKSGWKAEGICWYGIKL